MTMPTAKEVAKHLDRRQQRRKVVLILALVGAIILAVTYYSCGQGWGLGGAGKGEGSGPGSVKGLVSLDAGVQQCEVKLSPGGILVDGVKATRAGAVAKCKAAGRAMVIVTGDTVQGEWDALKKALEAAHVEVYRRESK
jgi:hypothetical protein